MSVMFSPLYLAPDVLAALNQGVTDSVILHKSTEPNSTLSASIQKDRIGASNHNLRSGRDDLQP